MDPILALPFPAGTLAAGKRELHHATRKYFDVENRSAAGLPVRAV